MSPRAFSSANLKAMAPEFYLAAADVLGKPGVWQYTTYELGNETKPLLFIVTEANVYSGEVDHQILQGEAYVQVFRTRKITDIIDREPVEATIRMAEFEKVIYGVTPMMKDGQIVQYILTIIAKDRTVDRFTEAVSACMGNPKARISDYRQGKEQES